MESLLSWREFKARQKNAREREEIFVPSHSRRNNSPFDIPMPERIIVIAKIRYTMLAAKYENIKTELQRENFMFERDMWFAWLKDAMRDHKFSKEKLQEFGLNWNDCKKLAYGN